jgi:hypothetical protein
MAPAVATGRTSGDRRRTSPYRAAVDHDAEVIGHYEERYDESVRLSEPAGQLEFLRTTEVLSRYAKTRILEGEAARQHFEDSRKDAIQYGLDIQSDVTDDLRSLFDDAVSGQEVNERDVRFAINRFRKLGDDYAVTWILRIWMRCHTWLPISSRISSSAPSRMCRPIERVGPSLSASTRRRRWIRHG